MYITRQARKDTVKRSKVSVNILIVDHDGRLKSHREGVQVLFGVRAIPRARTWMHADGESKAESLASVESR